ncbi:MAG: hypothetical protein QXP39_01080 [Candidatus Aenigmatarchaeota archaeon]
MIKNAISYYSRDDVQNIIFDFSREREIVGVFENGVYGQRPNMFLSTGDILSMVKQGMVEFHCSLERWSNPMALKPERYDELRTGWDLVIDLDCKNFFYGKIAVKAIVWALRKHKTDFWIKFSGGKGFHICIPWEAIPKDINLQPTAKMFPELARDVCAYIKYFAREKFERELLLYKNPEQIAKELGIELKNIMTDEGINPWKIVEIDPLLISPRHLFRMPYSINAKTGLVSVLLEPSEIEDFKKEMAVPELVEIKRFPVIENESADILFIETSDWARKQRKTEKVISPTRRTFKRETPPCIKTALQGLSDGRKRALFIMLNYFKSIGWDWGRIENEIWEWNKKNKPPLRDTYVRTQLRYSKDKKPILPPNCTNETYYKSFGICKPDEKCKMIKNPVGYGKKLKTKRKY